MRAHEPSPGPGRRTVLKLAGAVFGVCALAACGAALGGFGALVSAPAAQAATDAPSPVRVGVVPGPDVEIWEQVRKLAAANGLKIDLVQFSDYIIPNQALANGDIEANAFQHEPYLRNQLANNPSWKLVKAGETITSPMGAYSSRHKTIDAIPAGGTVAVPNDPTNGGRALKLLSERGVLKLNEGVGADATVRDIADNPKKLKVIELDAAQIARSLPDVDLAVINSNYAVEAGLDPQNGALIREDVNGPWVNIIAVRAADLDKPWVKALVAAYQTPQIRDFILSRYKGVYIPAW